MEAYMTGHQQSHLVKKMEGKKEGERAAPKAVTGACCD